MPEAGAKLLDALLGFVEAAGPETFHRLTVAVAALPVPAEGSRVLTWPNVTVLPFLADPTRFMVSKPEIFRQIAARMDVELSSSNTVKWDSYARVLDVSRQLPESSGAARRHGLHRCSDLRLGDAAAQIAPGLQSDRPLGHVENEVGLVARLRGLSPSLHRAEPAGP